MIFLMFSKFVSADLFQGWFFYYMAERGRPSKIEEKGEQYWVDKILEFFDVEFFITRLETFYYKNGDTKEKEIDVANSLPFMSQFERENKLGLGRCSKWAKLKVDSEDPKNDYKYLNFRQAYKMSKEIQKEMLISNGLKGLYNATSYIFTAKNIAGMRDQQDITSGGEKISPILVKFLDEKPENNQHSHRV